MPNKFMKKATHCARGHKYTKKNTARAKCSKSRGGMKRQCRKCKSEAMKARRRDLRKASQEIAEIAEQNFSKTWEDHKDFWPTRK